jgi:two-component system response regulator YesN
MNMADIMLIDSEGLSRKTIRERLLALNADVNIVCEAEDFNTAMEQYLLHYPQIIVADMSVNYSYGLELVAHLQHRDPQIQFLLLADNELNFSGLQLDMHRICVLKKSAEDSELSLAVYRAIHHIKKDRNRQSELADQDWMSPANLSHLQEWFLSELELKKPDMPHTLAARARQLQLPLEGPYYISVSLRFEASLVTDTLWGAAHYLLRELLYELVRSTELSVYAFLNNQGRVSCVFSSKNQHPEDELEDLLMRLINISRTSYDMEVVAGVGPVVTGLEKLYQSRAGAISAVKYQSMMLDSEVVHYRDLEKLGVLSSTPVYDHVRTLFRMRKQAELMQFMRAHCSDPKKTTAFLFDYITILTDEAIRAGVEDRQLEDCAVVMLRIFRAENLSSVMDAVETLTEQLLKQILARQTTNTNQLMSMAKEYILEHLENDQLNLEQVSQYVGLSRIYFCKRFHQSEGVSFSNYLKNIRIKRAKQLLEKKRMKIAEVGSAVGFSNPKYFSFVFKQATGLTPLEYQKQLEEV